MGDKCQKCEKYLIKFLGHKIYTCRWCELVLCNNCYKVHICEVHLLDKKDEILNFIRWKTNIQNIPNEFNICSSLKCWKPTKKSFNGHYYCKKHIYEVKDF